MSLFAFIPSYSAWADSVIGSPIPAGNSPRAIAFDSANGNLYVANFFSNSVSVIDGSTNTVVDTIPVGGNPLVIAFDSANGNLYVVTPTIHSVSVIDGSTNTIIGTINIGTQPSGIAFDSANGKLYVTNEIANSVSVIDGSTNTLVGAIPIGKPSDGIAFDSANGNLYVANTSSNSVSVIDGSTNTLVGTIPVGSNPLTITFDSANNNLYVTNFVSNSVSIIDGSTNAIIGSPIPVGNRPSNIAFDSANDKLYVTNEFSNSVSIIDGSTNTVIGTIPVGSQPDGIAFDSANGNLYVANTGSNSVYAIQPTYTAPTITPVITGTLGNNDWYTSDVSVTWTVNDNGFPITSTACTTTNMATDAVGQTVTCTATNFGGTSTNSVTINLDKTAPTITGAVTTSPNVNGWYNSDVVIHYTASDSLSGLVSSPDDTVISTEGSGQSTSQTVTDLAGNAATATISGINLDKTAPTITAPADVIMTSSTPVSPSLGIPIASDNLDSSPIVTNNAPLSFASGTTTTVTWTATDQAGNSASSQQTVIIQTPVVQTPMQEIQDLKAMVDGMHLKKGTTNSLDDKLEEMIKNLTTGHSDKIKEKLNAFIKEVNAQTGKSISSTQSSQLTSAAQTIINSLPTIDTHDDKDEHHDKAGPPEKKSE